METTGDEAGRKLGATGGALPARVHCLGIGGAGVSGAARILAARGVRVSGHDRARSPLCAELDALGIEVVIGPSSAELLPPDAELVVRSAAVPRDDPQVAAALARGVAVWKYSELLGRLAAPERTLAVAGTHGKTTTSWMLWHALEGLADETNGATAGALVGGTCRRLQTNALAGAPQGWFCVEACEYDRSFLQLAPHGAIVTNVEPDHLDYYHTFEAIRAAFARFLSGGAAGGLVVLGRDVPEDVELGASAPVWRLGRELQADLLGEERGRFTFRLRGPGWATPPVRLAVPGHFNVDNAALALALAVGLALRAEPGRAAALAAAAARGIERFTGVDRRFQGWGEVDGVTVVHDYAHHPTEVRVTIEAALRSFPERPLHVLFQPHQHSRTARFLCEFAESLRAADAVCVADVYGARAHIDDCQAGAEQLVEELVVRGVRAQAGGPLGPSVARFVEWLPRPAAALVLGAGDVETVREDLLERLALRRAPSRAPRG